MANVLYILFGTISLIFGIIGLIIPGLPGIPFVLLTAWLYLRGSKKMYNRLQKSKIFGFYLREFFSEEGITLKVKLWFLAFLTITVVLSCIFFIPVFWMKAFAVGTGLVGGLMVVFLIPTHKVR
jgi:uncharacterized protein